MPNRRLDNWLSTYAEHTAISEAPATFHFWTGVSVIAGALRRRVWIEQKIFQWTPNFYIILVAPPGVATKSTAMKIGHKLLKKVPGIKFGPQSMSWQGLLTAMSEATVGFRTDTGVITREEKDKESLAENVMSERSFMSCLTCSVSELGTFLRPKDADLTDFLVDMWDGQKGTWERKLVTKDAPKIENPWLNIIGCTTPSWLRANFTSEMIFGGLTSRCIFVWGEKKAQLIAYPGDMIQDEEYFKREEDLIHDLKQIAQMFGPMQLSPEAKTWGDAWYRELWSNRPKHLASDRFSGYIARKQTMVHKLAMVVSAAISNDMTIGKEAVETAAAIVTSMERDMVVVFDSITDSESAKHVDEIMTIIRRNKTIHRRTLWKHCIRLMDEQQFTAALNAAVNAGYITSKNLQYAIKKED